MKSRMLQQVCGLAALAVWTGLGMQQAGAAPFAPSASEMAALPPLCKAKLSGDSADDKQYSGSIGPDWLHIHHYCFGLNFANRYYKDSGNRAAQADDLKQALNNYDYVLDHATRDFWMRAEIGTQKGRMLAAAKRTADAIMALETALKANPDYAPAYAVLSDVYRDSGQKAKALAKVEQGLQRVPLDKPLQRRYKQLAGKVFVPPVTAEAAAPRNVQEASPETAAEPAGAASATQAADEAVTKEEPDKIGVPGNPYCRFCP